MQGSLPCLVLCSAFFFLWNSPFAVRLTSLWVPVTCSLHPWDRGMSNGDHGPSPASWYFLPGMGSKQINAFRTRMSACWEREQRKAYASQGRDSIAGVNPLSTDITVEQGPEWRGEDVEGLCMFLTNTTVLFPSASSADETVVFFLTSHPSPASSNALSPA